MKEEKTKKTTTKKTSTKKVSASKKTTGVKKTTTKKKSVTPKKTAPKKQTNISTAVESVIKEEVKVEPKKEVKRNTDLLLRAILTMSYTLITVILVIGFGETYINNLKVEPAFKPPYLVQQEILNKSNILTLDNAKEVLGSLDGDYFVYVGYTKMYNGEMRILDMGISGLIEKYDLKDKFYYLNIDSIIRKKNKVALVNSYLGYKDVLISKVPTIVYVNSENIVRRENIITREDDKLITVGDFQKLLDINQFVVKK